MDEGTMPWDGPDESPPIYDLYTEENQIRRKLNEDVKKMREDGITLAKCEYEYQVNKALKTLEYRDIGMAATVIAQIINGVEPVATLRFERDCAQVEYDADKESINVGKKNLGIVEAQLQREWSTPQASF